MQSWDDFINSIPTESYDQIFQDYLSMQETGTLRFGPLREVSKVYAHITGHKLSKTMYFADVIIPIADDHYEEKFNEDVLANVDGLIEYIKDNFVESYK